MKAEREKFIKYINEFQAYDEKVILEYQKVKKQLQIEVQKNNMNNNNPKSYFRISKSKKTITNRSPKK